MPRKNKQSASAKTSILPDNKFAPLGSYTASEEKKEHQERQSKTHEKVDIWKLLVTDRRKCRSLQYQLWAAVLIEKDGLAVDDGGLNELLESILIDPRMGDHHIARLPAQYHEKMRLCTKTTFLDDKNIEGNVNKYAAFLQKWHSDLIKEINDQLGPRNNYIMLDESGKNIINPIHREKIKEIIINNSQAKKIRQELNLSNITKPQEESKEKASESKPKTGMDYYLDYLLTDNEEVAEESLNKSAELGYIDNGVDDKKPNKVLNEEYYFKMTEKFINEEKLSVLKKFYLNGARKGSMIAQYFLGLMYLKGVSSGLKLNPTKSKKYLEMSAKQDFAPAQYYLSLYYLNTLHQMDLKNGPEKDISKGIEWLTKAANQDDLIALRYLAGLYRTGDNVEKNIDKAMKLYKRAAELGDNESKNFLGVCYLNNGKKKEGIELIKEVADLGVASAQYSLGVHYLNDDHKPYEGMKLIEKAAEQNFAIAIEQLKIQKNYFNTLKRAEKNLKYYIVMTDDKKVAIVKERMDKIIELINEVGFDTSMILNIYEKDGTTYAKVPLATHQLKQAARELLGLDRVRSDKLTPEQQIALQDKLPKATMEIDPDDNSKMLITWPIVGDKEEYRKFVYQSIKEAKGQPNPVLIHPIAKSAYNSTTSSRSKE